jgi:hypothetical protein
MLYWIEILIARLDYLCDAFFYDHYIKLLQLSREISRIMNQPPVRFWGALFYRAVNRAFAPRDKALVPRYCGHHDEYKVEKGGHTYVEDVRDAKYCTYASSRMNIILTRTIKTNKNKNNILIFRIVFVLIKSKKHPGK